MPKKLPPQLDHEIASVPRPIWWGFPAGERISSHIARSEGFAESSAMNRGPGVYNLFEEMEDKDPHLYSILQTRKNGVLARPRKIESASTRPDDVERADWLKRTLERLRNFDVALLHMLDGLAKGMAVIEVIWGYDAGGRVVPVELKPRNAGRFNLGPDDGIFLNDPAAFGLGAPERLGQTGDRNRPLRSWSPVAAQPSNSANGSATTHESSFLGRRQPARKFMIMLFDASDERPHGRGLSERVYWYWWFKKTNTKFWVMYNEKFGAPTIVARHQPGLSEAERGRLLEVISSLQADAGVTLPEGITLELLESTRRGSAETYRDLSQWCNDEMSRAVLGQTLTHSEGRRGGSLAMARVHDSVRFDYIRTDSCLLMDVVNSQLVRWIMDFNFGEGSEAPRWTIDLTPEIDRDLEVRIDRQLLQMGVSLPLRYFYEKYGRPAVDEDERQLRYDDNNLYQYHLQFGVLTVNEVRASLGLDPVPWGDRPPSPAAIPTTLPTPPSAAGDGPTEESKIDARSEQPSEASEIEP